ncbi:MAG: 2-succinyl-6-hydroxy-2,4-cyclohexadiene-1-carboxylate synthase [Kurthia sp.]|nr:2-succinyl-6-hydroxy-2,4-cyclohexadiene-1-carboxylate synthase [Candidatus Kurthia equi]
MASVVTTINGIDVHYEVHHARTEKTIVFLHGFTGSTKTWHEVMKSLPQNCRMIAIDLMGHGKTASPKQVSLYTMEQQVELLEAFFAWKNIEQFDLIGYSMGGRVALAYALAHPQRISTLILESSSPGLEDLQDREARMESDHLLAARIQSEGVEVFVDYWQDIALFHTQKSLSPEQQQAIREERLQQTAIGLANSLRGMGTGQQKSYWDKLSKFSKPVVLLSGALDAKFIKKAQQMAARFPHCEHRTILESGHAIHVENPQSFATIVKEQLHL